MWLLLLCEHVSAAEVNFPRRRCYDSCVISIHASERTGRENRLGAGHMYAIRSLALPRLSSLTSVLVRCCEPIYRVRLLRGSNRSFYIRSVKTAQEGEDINEKAR